MTRPDLPEVGHVAQHPFRVSSRSIRVVQEPIHGVECYEAWRDEEPCPHEAATGRTGPQEVEAVIAKVAHLRGAGATDVWQNDRSVGGVIDDLFAALDYVTGEYRFMCHVFNVATKPSGSDEQEVPRG